MIKEAAGVNTQAIRCEKCGNVICVRRAETNSLIIKKHGRVITIEITKSAPTVRIKCERCGYENLIG